MHTPFDWTAGYPSVRSPVFARNVVATSHPLAAQAGLRMLAQGGNAVDAAVATAACMTLVEPCSNGLGSDAFALVWEGQRLHGLNSTHVRRKLENGPALQTLYTQAAKNPGRALDELYLTILSRPPTAEEREQIRTYRGKASLSDRQVAVDVAWALINTPEFLYRH